MPFQVSPGVNVSEIDLTTIVPAVQTTGAGVAGHFSWGPVDTIVLVSDENSLVNNFQKPNANTADDFFTASNFLAYSNDSFAKKYLFIGLYLSIDINKIHGLISSLLKNFFLAIDLAIGLNNFKSIGSATTCIGGKLCISSSIRYLISCDITIIESNFFKDILVNFVDKVL